jgi:c-di-GMP-binding flagellar brake protein YcgR
MRSKVKAKITFTHPSVGSVLLDSGDISDGGVFILKGDITPPELGEKVSVQMIRLPMQAPIVTMKVVRYTTDGMGLKFAFNEDNSGILN